MTKNPDGTTRTLATMVRILDDPAATPEQIRIAMGWGAIPPGSALDWLRGYAAGVRDGQRRMLHLRGASIPTRPSGA